MEKKQAALKRIELIEKNIEFLKSIAATEAENTKLIEKYHNLAVEEQ